MKAVLRAMQRTGDRQKVLAAHGLPLSDERLKIEVFDFERTEAVEGRVLVHGEEEQSGHRYLILEGVDARAHFINYTPEMAEARANGALRATHFPGSGGFCSMSRQSSRSKTSEIRKLS